MSRSIWPVLCRASKSTITVLDPNFRSKMSGLWIHMYLYALLWTIPFNMGGYVTIIFMIWEKISRWMCFQPKCPDFLLKLYGILHPRMPPFRRSGALVHTKGCFLFSCLKPCLRNLLHCLQKSLKKKDEKYLFKIDLLAPKDLNWHHYHIFNIYSI